MIPPRTCLVQGFAHPIHIDEENDHMTTITDDRIHAVAHSRTGRTRARGHAGLGRAGVHLARLLTQPLQLRLDPF